MENVIIKFTADTTGLQPAVDQLKLLGKISEEDARKIDEINQSQAKYLNTLKATTKEAGNFSNEMAQLKNEIQAGVLEGVAEHFAEMGKEMEGAGKKSKTLKQELKELKSQIASGGLDAKQLSEATKRAAELTDHLGDVNQKIKALSSDTKRIDAVVEGFRGLAAGVAITQGAIGLLGGENEKVEKTLLKVQSAMALQQGITGIYNAVDSFKLLSKEVTTNTTFIKINELANKATAGAMKLFGVAVDTTSTSFKLLKGAIAATGIGLLVIAIGELVSAFQSYTSAAEEAAEATKKANEEAIKYTNEGLKAEQEFLKQKEKLDIAKAKSVGKTEEEIFNLQQNYRGQNIRSLQRAYNEAKGVDEKRADEIKKQIDAINNDGQVAELDNQTKLNKIKEDAAKQASDKRKEEAKKQIEDLKAQQDALKNIISKTRIDIENDADKTEEQKLDRQRQRDIAELDAVKLSAKDKAEALALINKKYQILNDELDVKTKEEKDKKDKEDKENKEKSLKERTDKLIEDELKRIKLIQDAETAAKDLKLKLDEEEWQSTKTKYDIIGNAAATFSDILGKQTAAGKALGIASALINTYVGATEVLRAKTVIPEPFGTIQKIVSVASILATGFKSIKAITSVQVPGGGGGGSVSAPSAPSAPILPQASSTTLNQGQVNQIGNVAARAFVVESDVSGQQERIRRLNRAARIS